MDTPLVKDIIIAISKNTGYGIISSIVRMGSRLVMIPIIISYLGLEGYGIWSIFMTLMAYMQLGITGAKSALQKYVAEATGTGDYNRSSRLLSTALIIIIIFCTLGLIPFVVFSRNLVQLMGVPDQFIVDTVNSIILLAFALAISNIGGVFESIITGVQRIDIIRKLDIYLLPAEAVAIIIVLLNGYSLSAMTIIISASQICRSIFYYLMSARLLPQVHIRLSFFSRSVMPELIQFAGSFQLINIFAVTYLNVLPLIILKLFGAQAAGIYAVCTKLVDVATVAPEALLLPLLSGGTLLNYSSKTFEYMGIFLEKSIKATITFSLPVFAFIVVFGEKIVFAWTGQQSQLILPGLLLLCFANFFRIIARVCFILYRATGGSKKDIIWQILRILSLLLAIGVFVSHLGYNGVLVGNALAEFLGVVYIFVSISKNFKGHFGLSTLACDVSKLLLVTIISLTICLIITFIPLPFQLTERILVFIRLCAALSIFILLAILILGLIGYLSPKERQTLALLFR